MGQALYLPDDVKVIGVSQEVVDPSRVLITLESDTFPSVDQEGSAIPVIVPTLGLEYGRKHLQARLTRHWDWHIGDPVHGWPKSHATKYDTIPDIRAIESTEEE